MGLFTSWDVPGLLATNGRLAEMGNGGVMEKLMPGNKRFKRHTVLYYLSDLHDPVLLSLL